MVQQNKLVSLGLKQLQEKKITITYQQRQFDAWATLSGMNLAKTSDGDYTNLAVSSCWSAWTAATAKNNYLFLLSICDSSKQKESPLVLDRQEQK